MPYRTSVRVGGHEIVVDAAREQGGGDAGPGPVGMLVGSLCACVAMTVKMYAARKEWVVRTVDVAATHEREGHGPVTAIALVMRVDGDLSQEQRRRLLEIARACPVHKTLAAGVRIEVG